LENRSAVAFPIPELAPVIMAVLDCNRLINQKPP
jgi:hypothetical protein